MCILDLVTLTLKFDLLFKKFYFLHPLIDSCFFNMVVAGQLRCLLTTCWKFSTDVLINYGNLLYSSLVFWNKDFNDLEKISITEPSSVPDKALLEPASQPTNLLVTFLEYSSIVMLYYRA